MANLLPNKTKLALISLYKKRLIVVSLWMICSIFIISSILMGSLFVVLKLNNQSLTKLLTFSDGLEDVRNANKYRNDISAANEQAKIIVNNNQQNISPTYYIDKINNLKSKKIKINIISVERAENSDLSISFNGSAETRSDIVDFINQLEKSGEFTEVNAPVSNFIKSTDSNFTITVVINKK